MTSTSTSPAASGWLARLAALAHRRRGRVLVAWLVGLVAATALAAAFGGESTNDFTTKGSESARATELLRERFDGRSGDAVSVVWEARDGALKPAARARVDRFLAAARRVEGIGGATPPRAAHDGTIATATLELNRRAWNVPTSSGERLLALADDAERDGLRIALGGHVIQNAEEGGSPESVGFLAAAIVLLIAFGSVVAAGLPLAIALLGLGISIGLIGLLSALVDVPEFAPAVAGLIGIGVGIDYALLVLTRFRAALHAGAEREQALTEAVTTAGRSVLVAGTTVIISLLGLFLMGLDYLRGVALSASLSVLVVMIGAVTLLPALLSYAGPRIDRLRLPGLGRQLASGRRGVPLAARWSASVQRRPWTAVIAGSTCVLALAVPALDLRLGFPDEGNDPAGSSTRTAYDLIAKGFGPGVNGPLMLVAELPRDGGERTLARIDDAVRADRDVAAVAPPRRSADGGTALIGVTPRSSPQDERTPELVRRLRDEVLPGALAGGGSVAVGGTTAGLVDQSDLIGDRLPLFIAGVVVLSLLLLLSAFRSPLIALKAAVMTLLSVGAAYGVVALFANAGWFGAELLDIDSATPVAPFIPVMMFAILFGLSMDYEVFLLSRVREEYLATGDTTRAVADGLARTARVITAAAAIMVVVFLSFVASSEVFLKLLGIGMAAAILVDATIVRMVLVPGLMQLLGRANWWIPRWLDRLLPRLDPEAAKTPRISQEAPAEAR